MPESSTAPPSDHIARRSAHTHQFLPLVLPLQRRQLLCLALGKQLRPCLLQRPLQKLHLPEGGAVKGGSWEDWPAAVPLSPAVVSLPLAVSRREHPGHS